MNKTFETRLVEALNDAYESQSQVVLKIRGSTDLTGLVRSVDSDCVEVFYLHVPDKDEYDQNLCNSSWIVKFSCIIAVCYSSLTTVRESWSELLPQQGENNDISNS